jgi:hypothetical protein
VGLNRRTRWLIRVTGWLPRWLLEGPERVMLYFAVTIIGITAFWPPPGSLFDLWPDGIHIPLACALAGGGFLSLIACVTRDQTAERVGAVAVFLSTGIVGLAIFDLYRWSRLGTAVIFCFLALAALIRLLRSTATAAAVLGHLRFLAEAQQREAEDLEEHPPEEAP